MKNDLPQEGFTMAVVRDLIITEEDGSISFGNYELRYVFTFFFKLITSI